MQAYHYNWIIIGAGPGGYEGAIRAAQLGLKVALIEEREAGGTCLNRGCIPTKALLHSAQAYYNLSHMGELGINITESGYDINAMYQKKQSIVDTLRKGVEGLIKQNKINLIAGRGVIIDSHKVRVGDQVYDGERIMIATGSLPAKLNIPGGDLPGVMTSDELLEKPFKESSLVIIGGGVIGIEFAYMLSCLNKNIIILEAAERILPQLDKEISQNTAMILKKRGVQIFTNAFVKKIQEDGAALKCLYEHKENMQEAIGDRVLMAIGRKAMLNGLFDKEMVLPLLEKGYISINERGETSIPNIYAIGDVTGGLQLAHRASAQAIYCIETAMGHTPNQNISVIPSCVYTRPEIASVGMTEDEVREEGIVPMIGKYLMSGNGKTMVVGGERGFIKLIFDKESEILLGTHLMCERATDMINELTLAIAKGMTRDELLACVRPHPTFSEGITEALEAAVGMAIHGAPVRRAKGKMTEGDDGAKYV